MRNSLDSVVGILGLRAGEDVNEKVQEVPKIQNMRASLLGASIAACAIILVNSLTGCGGGTEDFVKTKPDCPNAQADDVWINNRLGCAVVGAPFINVARNANGSPVDRAFGVAQVIYNPNSVILNGGKTRYFNYFLCVKGVPDKVSGTALAGDLQFALELSLGNRYVPSQIGFTALEADNSGPLGVPFVDEACDPAKHPIIVNYSTGLVESINTSALAAIIIYDK